MKRFQGLRVNETEQWGRDYTRETVREVYRHAAGWSGWSDLIRWLNREAEADDKLNPGQIAGMKEDFEKVLRQGEPYTDDPGKAFDAAHKYRLKKAADLPKGPSRGVI